MIFSLMKSEAAENQTFNIGNETPEITMSDLAEIIIAQVQKPIILQHGEDTAGSQQEGRLIWKNTLKTLEI